MNSLSCEVEQQLSSFTTDRSTEEKTNAMIPNKLSFDPNLQDLPARATEIGQESIIKLLGGCTMYFKCFPKKHKGGNPVTGVQVNWNDCSVGDGTWACNQTNKCKTVGGCNAY